MDLRRLHIDFGEQNHQPIVADNHIQAVALRDIPVVAGNQAVELLGILVVADSQAVRSLTVVAGNQASGSLVAADHHNTVDWDLIVSEKKKKKIETRKIFN